MALDLTEAARGITTAIPFNKTVGFELVEYAPGFARVRVGFEPLVRNHVGTMHAAIVFGVAEWTSGVVFMDALVEKAAEIYGVARESRIEYVAPAQGPVVSRAVVPPERMAEVKQRILAGEPVDTFVDITVHDEATEREVARCHFEISIRPARQGEGMAIFGGKGFSK